MPSTYLTLLETRFSCRKFTPDQLTNDELTTILESVRKSPSAKNLQPTRICVVQSPEGLAKIDECTKCRYGAPTVLIVAYDSDAAAALAGEFGPETCTFGDIDATIAITNMDNAAATLDLGACWVGAFDHNLTRKLFNVPDNYKLVELLMLGHKDASPSPRHEECQPLEKIATKETF